MTSPNSTLFSEDFDLNLKPIQNSLMEKFRSYLGQNNIPTSIKDNHSNFEIFREIFNYF